MEFRKAKCEGVWFSWPVVVYYNKLGIELRYLKWLIGVNWRKSPVEIKKG